MDYVTLVLRLIHVVAGVFWVGSAMVSTFFLTPAVAATGSAGQQTMAHMVNKGRMSVRIMGAAILTVLAGAALYWRDSQGFTSAWTSSGPGWGFGIGAVLALAGMGFGMAVGQSAHKLGEISAATKGNPSPEQIAELKAIQKRMSTASNVSTALLILALVCMATARYWGVG